MTSREVKAECHELASRSTSLTQAETSAAAMAPSEMKGESAQLLGAAAKLTQISTAVYYSVSPRAAAPITIALSASETSRLPCLGAELT